ncbi:4'-phosphopantetheinyl transferase family protein [Metabacillus arenae]|uniref:4'-phosphopantetheinyl transferase superfamily protein n=1 Tax=Metabacillus arenae TaxID=2771434 RepID=A0A926NK00_9BACI|nr:4'-phosphopantetheinyl transferase superfamily protein [Metabacillus arenae]MBD1379482.1 4'-phosphopantetheinyl transferase superfamily protein [Metabacillus arenae]
MKIYAVNIDKDLVNHQFNDLLLWLDNDKRHRIQSFFHYKDAQRTLIGDILTRYMLIHYLKFSPDKISFETNKFGKPFIMTSDRLSVYFNLSHSGSWVVCVLGEVENGIDIQKIEDIDMNVAQRFFSHEEYAALLELSEKERIDYFYHLWTLKESYIKAIGEGLSIPLNSFLIQSTDANQYVSSTSNNKVYLQSYYIDSNHKMAVCSFENDFTEKIVKITNENLYYLYTELSNHTTSK